MLKRDQAFLKFVHYKMAVDLNVFCPLMKNRIVSNVDSRLTVTKNSNGTRLWDRKLFKQSD